MNVFLHKNVDRLVASLEKPTRSKWIHLLVLLEKYGSSLGMPHLRPISRDLSELRVRGNQELRAFVHFKGEQISILHAFIKKTQKIPQREIKIAQNRLVQLTNV